MAVQRFVAVDPQAALTAERDQLAREIANLVDAVSQG